MFRREREAVIDAAETAREGINVALIVAGLAIVLASVAIVVSVTRSQ
jgi:hypothetical protein